MKTGDEVFGEQLSGWLKARRNKKKRGEIARHMVFATKRHPKSVARAFKRLRLRDVARKDKRGRPRYYDASVVAALRDIREVGDRGCGELIRPMIGRCVAILKKDTRRERGDEATGKLHAVSERTVKRIVAKFRAEDGTGKRGLSGTSPSALKHIIPIRKGPRKDTLPGDGRLDTVARCGESLAGSFIWSLNRTDVAACRTVIRARRNKGQEATKESAIAIRASLPFPLSGLHPDSGSEFINRLLKDRRAAEGIALSRSEPYKKNDNMRVEERNGHVIRKYLGRERLDDITPLPQVNDLCRAATLYVNHRKAVRRTASKERVGAKRKRTHEKRAVTPHERVTARKDIAPRLKEKLCGEHDTLNPSLLLQKIAALKEQIYRQQKALRNRAVA